MSFAEAWKGRVSWLLTALVVFLLAFLIWNERTQFLRAIPYLRQANWRILLLIGLSEIGYFILQGQVVRILYRLHDRNARLSHTVPILMNATMLNEVVPTSGASGIAGFMYWGVRLGYGARASASVNVLLLLINYLTLAPIIAICVRAYTLLPDLPRSLILSSFATMLLAIVLIGILLFIMYLFATRDVRLPYIMRNALSKRLSHFRVWLKSYTNEQLSKEWRRVRSHLRELLLCALLFTMTYVLRMLMLRLSFAALHQFLPMTTAAYVYSLTLIFSVVSPLPTTLGVVEVALTTSLSWFGVPVPLAIATVILYRLETFWLAIPLGVFSQWWLAFQANRSEADY